MTQERVELGVGALVVAAVVGFAAGDNATVDSILYVGVLVGASIAAWVGAERAPVGHRLVGRLIAAGITMTAVGDMVWEVLDGMGTVPDVSIADPAWFASYVMICAALWIVLRRSSARDRDDVTFVIDAATVVVVSVLVFWSFSIEKIVADQGLAPHVRLVWAAYPVLDAVLLALVVRVLMSRGARAALDVPFAIGVGLWLAADIAYLQSPTAGVEVLMDAAWMVGPVLMVRTVWRLGQVPAGVPAPAAPSSSMGQLVIAIGPLLVPPALELLVDLRGEPDQPVLLVVGSTALIMLAFVRTARLMRSEERALYELEVARDAALEASRAKSMFLATMSHEIRTPLTMVLGAGELLEDTSLDDFQHGLVKRMRRSGDLLRGLVDNILDFSRIEAGQLDVAATRFDLHDLVDGIADAHRPRADQAGVGFDRRLYPGVPRHVVGDPDRLLQVLGNLLDNAVKFTHEGRVSVEVRQVAPLGDAAGTETVRGVEFVVADSGIGICPADLASVFESFKQVDGSTTRRYGGSGLGLAICKQLTELMGGSLTATSELGLGSVFVVRLPLAPAHEASGDRGEVERGGRFLLAARTQ